MKFGFLVVSIPLTLLISAASASTVIPVANPSFESPNLGTAVYNLGPITGWLQGDASSVGGAVSGVFNPSSFPSAGYSAPNGTQVAFTGNGFGSIPFITQRIDGPVGVIVAGATYSLSVDIGQRSDYPLEGFTIELGYNTTNIFSNFQPFLTSFDPGGIPAAGTFERVTVSGVAPLSAAGQQIIISLASVGPGESQANWDAVALSSSVPEPSTWAMMLLGFVGIGFMAYRRKGKPMELRIA
jgi:hypothetical protein